MELPEKVLAATANAADMGFEMSCDPGAGALLSVLAGAVVSGGRILELGTGAGVGLAWIVHGLGGRHDVEVVSVEMDAAAGAAAARIEWPDVVELVIGDALDFIKLPAQWDLVFADAQGGKWEGLGDTVRSLRDGGVLLVDDMNPAEFVNDEHRNKTAEVRSHLLSSDELNSVEIAWSTGLILCTRRADSRGLP